MFVYSVKLERDKQSGSYVISCRDLPLLNSVGDTVEDALLNAAEAVVLAISTKWTNAAWCRWPARRRRMNIW